MNDTEIYDRLQSSYADVVLPDPLRQVMVRGSRVRRARRRMTAAAVAAVGVIAVASATVTTMGPDTSSVLVAQGVRLVAFTTPASPVSLQSVPPGLTPTVELNDGHATVRYQDSTSEAVVSLSARNVARADVVGERTVDVSGTPGRLLTGAQDGNVPRATLSWERQPGQWVTISGVGQYATPQALLTLAGTVTDNAVELTTRITLAPDGWVITFYKGISPTGGVLMLSDPTNKDRNLTIIGSNLPPAPVDTAMLEDPGPVTTVKVQGRDATLVQGKTIWYLSAAIGQGSFLLLAPADLTANQVVQIADTATLP